MNKTAAGRLLLITIFASAWAARMQATVPAQGKPVTHSKAELSAAADAALQKGFHAELPPHVSTLLGLTKEETCPVKQGVLRSSEKVQGFEVTEKNHNDIVIFVVNEATKDQTFYLTSPAGTLRRMLTVKQGVGNVVRPAPADVEEFEKEKKMWKERLAVPPPGK